MSDELGVCGMQSYMPTAEQVAEALAGIFARLFGQALGQMLEGEMREHLGYERYEAKGRNSGNGCNGRYGKKVRTSTGESTTIRVQAMRRAL